MALKIGKKNTRTFNASLVEPLDMDGKKTHSIEVEMKVFDKSEWERMTKVEKLSDQEILEKSLTRCIGLVDEHDQPLAFDDDSKKALLECPWVASGLIQYQLGIQRGQTTEAIRAVILGN